jgi:hypothetical protein
MDEEERRARTQYLMTLPWSAEIQLWWGQRQEQAALKSGDLTRLRDARRLQDEARRRMAARRAED